MTPRYGDRGTIRKFGGRNRQQIEVRAFDAETGTVSGLLLSLKHPGDFRGWVAGPIEDYRPQSHEQRQPTA